MRVIIDATTTQNEWKYNGIGYYTKNIVTHLIKQFPNTTFVLLMYNSPSEIDSILDGKYENVEVVRMGEFKRKNLLNPMWYINQVFPGMETMKYLKRIYEKGDVFFSPFFWLGLPLTIPFVVTIHDFALPIFNMYSQITPLHNLARAFTYWVGMLKTLNAKAILTNTNNTSQDYAKYLPWYPKEKIHLAYLGVDIEEIETDVDNLLPKGWKDTGYIINIGGGYTKNKNTGGIIESYARYVETVRKEGGTPAYLVIAGKNFQDRGIGEVNKLHELIEKYDIKELVHFTGFYETNQRYSLLKNSLLAINISLYEGFGFALLEGMKVGTPTISSNASCYPEVVKDGAYLVDGNNYDEVSSAIVKVIKDRSLSKELAQKGRMVASEYSWEKCAKESYNVIVNSIKE